MDIFLVLLFVVAVPLTVFLFFLLLAYALPLRFLVSFAREEHREETTMAVYWTILSFQVTTSGSRQEYSILLFDHPVFRHRLISSAPARTGTDPCNHDEKPVTLPDLVSLIQSLIEPATRIVSVLYRQSSFDEVRGRVRIGLGDPVATGMLYGGFCATRYILDSSKIFIDLQPVFDRTVLDVDLDLWFRIRHPLRIITAVIRVARAPGLRDCLAGPRQAGGVAV